MKTAKKKKYTAPYLTVVAYKTENGYATSGGLRGILVLGTTWENVGGNAWDGSSSENSGSQIGSSWVDEGSNAWS